MILVIGSTGLVGALITRGLLERGRDVRILVRPRSDFQPLVDAGAQPVYGDLKDPDSLRLGCRGAEFVITTASAGQRGGEDTPQSVDLDGNRNLIDAACAAGVGQFVFVSALTATEDHPVPLARAKAETERYLRSSGLPYTILASNGIMDVMFPLVIGSPLAVGSPVTLVGQGTRQHSWVAARDLACFAMAAVNNVAAIGRRIPLGGPEAVSWREIVATYERVLDRQITIRSVPPGTLLPNLPPVPGLSTLVSALMAALETFETRLDMTETARTFGVSMTSVEDFVRGAITQQPTQEIPHRQPVR
jgi:NADH dehydrogenase